MGVNGFHSNSTAVHRARLAEEIARIVADAKREGRMICTSDHAEHLRATYATGWSLGHVIDEIVAAAAAEGVPVEIARPHPESA
jgi:hypothetical protein